MPLFHGTFGLDHLSKFGIHYYIEIDAPDERLARWIMRNATDNKYCGLYTAEFGYPEKYPTRKLGRLIYSEHYDGQMPEIWYESKVD